MSGSNKKLALIGANGMLAQAVQKLCPSEYEIVPLDLPDFDITDNTAVRQVLGELQPTVVVNCAAFTNVDGCETAEETALLVNGTAVGFLAAATKEVGAVLVHISTDYIFDGQKNEPYLETDAPSPRSAYGRSKLLGEHSLVDSGLKSYFIIRTSWLFGPGGNNFVATMVRLATEREELGIVADQIGSPTYTEDLASAIFNLVQVTTPAPYGLYHFSNSGQCSWYDFTCEIIKQLEGQGAMLKVRQVLPIETEDYPLPAQRPAYSVFSKQKYIAATGAVIPEWQERLKRYLDTDKI